MASAPTTPAGFAAFLKEDRKAAETLIRIANTKPEEYKPEQVETLLAPGPLYTE